MQTPGADISVTLGSLQFQVKTGKKSPELNSIELNPTEKIQKLTEDIKKLKPRLLEAEQQGDKEKALILADRITRREKSLKELTENRRVRERASSNGSDSVSDVSSDGNEQENNLTPSPSIK